MYIIIIKNCKYIQKVIEVIFILLKICSVY
jgi:hypothetical protein